MEKEEKKLIEERKDLIKNKRELKEREELIEKKEKIFREKEELGKIEKDLEKKEKRLETYSETDIIEARKKKIFNFMKDKKDRIYYIILGLIVFLSVYIRTRNISKLKDITTGGWALGPDLDPYLFLRWAEYIVEHGKLMAIDTMRYVPNGFDTAREMILLPYLMAWFHNFLSFFSLSDSVTYSAIIFPVFMAGLTAIAFFLFTRQIFYKEDRKTRNLIALIATGFFVLIPSLLPRTIAGIPEKESAAFFFMFMAFYFFLKGFAVEKTRIALIFGALAGIITGLMALIWGGYIFVTIPISFAILFSFILGKVRWKEFSIYSLWLILLIMTMTPFSSRHNLNSFVYSIYHTFSIGIFVIIGISLFLIEKDRLKRIRLKTKLPKEIFYAIFSSLVLIILICIILGPTFIFNNIHGVIDSLVTPMTTRFGLTVAENKQPYFVTDWKGSFGPIVYNIPLFFWLFFIGSVAMFNHLIKKLNKKEKIILTFSYFIFLICLIFSRYSPNSVLNGISNLSLIVYFGGVLFFLGCFGYIYYKRYGDGELGVFREFNFAYILYFIILTISIIGARGGIRLIMVLGAISPVAISLLIVKVSHRYFKEKDETMKFFVAIITIIIILASIFTLWNYYQQDKYTGANFAPSGYNIQWQKAMSWVRENTSENAVFAHWWDYGYWVQSIGKRATILDGSNSIIYWNHLMGRYVLTGPNEKDALEFLYAHNGTHLLIDSTEIGKYTAYSSIGADENYDRFSWIGTFRMDESQTSETKDEMTYIYIGGTSTDEDIIWNMEGKDIFFPEKATVIGGIILRMNNEEIFKVEAIFIYGGQQYIIPLRYVYYNNKLKDFGTGLDAGIFIYPEARVDANNQLSMNKMGTLLYLSGRTVHSNLANLYLFDKNSENFKLAHTESNLVIEELRKQVLDIGEFIQYQGFQGPIKIWEINYPSNIEFKEEYLETKYPNEELRMADKGKY